MILSLGIVIALSVIAVPVLQNHISSSFSISKSEQKQNHSDSNQDTEQTNIAEFQAVTPVAQADFQLDYTLSEQIADKSLAFRENATAFIQKTSQKLFRILFRLIISPNAP